MQEKMIKFHKIQPFQCPSGWRRDCPHSKTCVFRHLGEQMGDPLPNTVRINDIRQKVTSAHSRRSGVYKQYSTRSQNVERNKTKEEIIEKKKWGQGPNCRNEIYTTNVEATGLRNIGNSCYINTTIQALSCVTPLIDQIRERVKENSDLETEEITEELGSLARELKSGKYQYVTPEALNRVIKEKSNGRFANGKQEDAHELLVFLLNQIHEETKHEVEGSVLEMTFSGKMETELICTRCNTGRTNQEKYNYVFLNKFMPF